MRIILFLVLIVLILLIIAVYTLTNTGYPIPPSTINKLTVILTIALLENLCKLSVYKANPALQKALIE